MTVNLKDMPNGVGLLRGLLRTIRDTVNNQNQLTVDWIKQHRMTGKGPFPVGEHRLGVKTNRLRNSLRRTSARITGLAVASSIGSNVKYAGAHEFGVTTRPHVIKASPGKALAFSVQNFFGVNRFSFATRQSIRQAARDAQVKAFLASGNVQYLKGKGKKRAAFFGQSPLTFVSQVNHPGSKIPARAPITYGIKDRAPSYERAMTVNIYRYLAGVRGFSKS